MKARVSTSRTRVPAVASSCVLIGAAAAVVLFGGVYVWTWVPVDLFLLLSLALVLALGFETGEELPAQKIVWPMAAFGVLIMVQAYGGASLYPADTRTALVQLGGCAATFYLSLLAFSDSDQTRWAGTLLWAFAGALAIEAIAQKGFSNGFIYWIHDARYASPFGPFVNRDDYAACAELLFPVSVVVAFSASKKRKDEMLIWMMRGIIPILVLASIILSQSRGGLLVILAELILGVLFYGSEIRKDRSRLRLMIPATAVAAGLLLLVKWQPLLQRFVHLRHLSQSTDIYRWWLTVISWRIFLAHIWVGTGFGTFSAILPQYQFFDSGTVILQAHNEFAQLLAETGVAGLLCMAGFCYFFIRRGLALRGARRSSSVAIRRAAFIGALGLMVHSLIEFPFHIPGIAILFFLLAGMAMTGSRHSRRRREEMPAEKEQPLQTSGLAAGNTETEWG